MKRLSGAYSWIAFSLMVSACHPKPCDDGYAIVRGVCVPKSSSAATPDAGTDVPPSAKDAGADGAAPSNASYRGFGDVCTDSTTHRECTLDADYCAKASPSDETGACTRIACLDNADLCPTDWTCCDISDFVSGDETFSVCLAMEVVPDLLKPKCRR